MPTPVIETLIILALVLANGLFAMAEIAIVSARKERLLALVREGHAGASTALSMANDPNRFLSTVQVGITLVGIVAGAFGGATLAGRVSGLLDDVPGVARYSDAIAFGAVVIAIAYLTVVLGELVPKRLGLRSPEKIASSVAPSMRVLSLLATPLVVLLSWSTEAMLKLLKQAGAVEHPVTEDEINLLMRQGLQAGSIESGEQQMVSGVFRLHDRPVSAFMTPRTEVIWLDANSPPDELNRKISQAKYSQFPICEGRLEDLIGVSSVKNLLSWVLSGNELELRSVAGPALLIPETVTGSEVLNLFLETDNNVGMVIDEKGAVEGIVTIDDILGEIVGDDLREIVRSGDSWIVDGRVGIGQLGEFIQVPIRLPQDERGRYHTLSGFMMARLDRMPVAGDSITWNDLRFEIQLMSGNRVERVKVTPEEAAPKSD